VTRASSAGAAIEITDLDKRFGDVHAVRDASFTVQRGRVTGFLGPNGAGKSTTLRMLLGLMQPDSGTALIDGKRYRDLPSPARMVGAVLDIAAAHPGMTARAHLRTCCSLAGIAHDRIDAVLAITGAGDYADRRIGTFSTGMRQRLSLATALLGDPEMLVLDEPSNGLDPAGIAWMRGFMRSCADAGVAGLLSSHIRGEVQSSADDVVLIDSGRIVRAGALTDRLAENTSLEQVFLDATTQGAHA